MSDSLTQLLQGQHNATVLQGIANPPQVNPLAAITAGNQAAQTVFNTRKMQAQQAMGQAYQQAIDPRTGRFDPLRFNTLLGADPTAAFSAQSGVESSQSLQGAQLDQNSKLNSLLNDGLNAALASPDANLKQSVLEQAQRLRAAGYPSDRIDSSLLHLSSDPAQLRQQLTTLQIQNMPSQQRQDFIQGKAVTQVGPGGNLIGATVAPTGAVTPPAGGQAGLPTGLDAAQQAQYQQWLAEPITAPDPADPTRQKQYPTRAAMFQDRNVDPRMYYLGGLQPGAGAPATTGGAPSVAPPPPPKGHTPRQQPATPAAPPVVTGGTGTETQPPATGAGPPPPGQQAQAPLGAGTAVTGPRPGQIRAAELTADESAKAGAALTQRADAVPTNRANFANMQADLDRIKNMPVNERQVALETALQKITGMHLTMTGDEVAASNSFSKLANQAIAGQLASMGATDSRQQLFMGANPHLDLSKLSNQQLIAMLQGNEDAIQAKSRAWNEWSQKNGTDRYGAFQDDFNRHFDPRVFQQQYMPKGSPELAALQRRLTGPDGKLNADGLRFQQDVQWAREHKMIE